MFHDFGTREDLFVLIVVDRAMKLDVCRAIDDFVLMIFNGFHNDSPVGLLIFRIDKKEAALELVE